MHQLPERLHSLPVLSLLICQTQKHPLVPPVLHKESLWFSSSLPPFVLVHAGCPFWFPSSYKPLPLAVQGNYFPALPRGGQSWSSADCWWDRANAFALLPLLLRAQPRTGNDIYTGPLSLSPSRQTPTCRSSSRGRRCVFVCMYVRECLQIELGCRSLLTGLRLSFGGLLYGVTVLWLV